MRQVAMLSPGAPEWTRMLDDYPHDFYHEPGYVARCAIDEQGTAAALYVEDDGGRMLVPLLVRDGLDAATPYGYPGPIGDPGFVADALRSGLGHLREEGLVAVFVRLHPILNAPPPAGIGTLVRHGDTVSIDLRHSIEEMWSETRADHRNQINRALRLGHVARIDADWANYGAFQALYLATMQRVGATDAYLFDEAYFAELRALLGERIHLCVVEIDGQVAAAGLFIETSGLVQYHLSATDERFTRDRPTKLMLHFARSWAKDRGNTRLHLGGGVGGRQDSLFEFKAGFSHDRHAFHTLRLLADPDRYAELVGTRRPGVDALDLTGFFPGYRAPD